MGVEIEEKKESIVEYPCLMIADDDIIYMISKGEGCSLKNGIYSSSWNMNAFKLFKGEVILKNK